ncbi:hypothetical protein [Agromyces sp. LHK192]|uniref:hypothetical protein n=1 Tax=Agromyces sp. LHK192 TaxID=2498704 RepID=UPI000FD8425A|nr:hypothetical protein [Agromyces sp. LHK192]
MGSTHIQHCDFSAADFRAVAFGAAGTRLIRVTGHGLCPSAGWSLDLVATNGGIVPHPESLWLGLREQEPTDASARVLTATMVEAIIEDAEATEIVIRFAWRPSIRIPVEDFATGVGAEPGALLAGVD